MTARTVYRRLQDNNKRGTQKELGEEYSSRDIENMSSNNTESVHISIVGLYQIILKSGYGVESDEEHQSDNYLKQIVDYIIKQRENKSITWIGIIIIFYLVCITTVIADRFGVNSDHTKGLHYLAFVLSVLMSLIILRYFIIRFGAK